MVRCKLGRRFFVFATIAVSLATIRSFADESKPDRAAAIALFDQARQLMKDGNYNAACPKLEESLKLLPGVGIRFNLSNCYEHIGRTASAWSGFRAVASASQRAGHQERETDARERLKALEPRLTRLLVDVPTAHENTTVTRNDTPIGKPSWGLAIPVDPGQYSIVARAPGKQPWEKTITAAGEGVTVRVVVPPLADLPVVQPPVVHPKPVPAPRSTAPPFSNNLPTEPVDSAARPWQKPFGLTLLGVGAAGLGVSAVLGIVAKTGADGADCNDDNICSQDGVDDRDKALTQARVATGFLIGGAVFASAGLVLWLTAPEADETPPVTNPIQTSVKLVPTGLVLRTRW